MLCCYFDIRNTTRHILIKEKQNCCVYYLLISLIIDILVASSQHCSNTPLLSHIPMAAFKKNASLPGIFSSASDGNFSTEISLQGSLSSQPCLTLADSSKSE